MTLLLAAGLDLAILALARRPGKPFRTLSPHPTAYLFAGVIVFPFCVAMVAMLTG